MSADPWEAGAIEAQRRDFERQLIQDEKNADYLQSWLDAHLPGSDHDRRTVDADMLPGTSRSNVGDEDPYGKRADAAAAELWWAQVEPESGRWAS